MNPGPVLPVAVRRRLWVAGAGTVVISVTLGLFAGHAGRHMARSLLVPGAGLYDERPLIGAGFTLLAIAATVAWARWGLDWTLAVVVAAAVAVTGLLGDAHTTATAAPAPQAAAHEFPLVILVLSAMGWFRSLVRRLPLADRMQRRRRRELRGIDDVGALPVVDRCRAAAIAALAGPWPEEVGAKVVAAIEAPDVVRRARRIGLWARGRRGGDPFRGDHAHTRAALALWDRLDAPGRARLVRDADAAFLGAPASEPGWTRLLDGTLAAIAVGTEAPAAAERWRRALAGPLRLHRGHRPGWMWTPLGVAAGRADEWEHATATALARRSGWIGDDDWAAIRQATLGAAARGARHHADERTVAAGRLWTALVDDEPAARILARPTIGRDPLAAALDALATTTAASRPRSGEGIPA